MNSASAHFFATYLPRVAQLGTRCLRIGSLALISLAAMACGAAAIDDRQRAGSEGEGGEAVGEEFVEGSCPQAEPTEGDACDELSERCAENGGCDDEEHECPVTKPPVDAGCDMVEWYCVDGLWFNNCDPGTE